MIIYQWSAKELLPITYQEKQRLTSAHASTHETDYSPTFVGQKPVRKIKKNTKTNFLQ